MFKGKTIVIIGGTSGFGLEVAHQIAEAHATIIVTGYNKMHMEMAVDELKASGADIKGYAFDATDEVQLTNFFSRIGMVDHVVSMLGGAMAGGFLDNDMATIRNAVEAKFFKNLQVAQICHGFIHEGGSLTFTSGTGGTPATASGAIIGNEAINTMVRGLSIEMAPKVRVNAVAPTWTPTGLWRSLTQDELAQQTQQVAAGIPLKRVAEIAEVASAYVYLMQNNFVTGQILNVDGGASVLS